ncbi:MAG: hypothetical protein QOG65_3854, partial [Actinomycetota bacterium]|nr:hypothetical protein [Actinomycetota bacterium]
MDFGRGVGPRRVVARLIAVTVSVTGFAAVSAQSATAASVPSPFSDSVVWSGLTSPTAVAFAPGGRVYISEKRGRVLWANSVSDPTPKLFVDISARVDDYWDRGLLGLAVDPGFGQGGHDFVYALYALDAPPGRTAPVWNDACGTPPGPTTDGCVVQGVLSRFPVNADGTAGAEQILLGPAWCQQFPSHSIGALKFGPDGKLYASAGDGASFNYADYGQSGGSLAGTPTPVNPCGDPPGSTGVALTSPTARGGALRSQSPRRPAGEPVLLNGSVLRLDPDTGAGVVGNPRYDSANPSSNASRIVAHGLRNPFRFT